MATTFDYSEWDWNRIEQKSDIKGECVNCGNEIDLNDGAIYDCTICAVPLRELS